MTPNEATGERAMRRESDETDRLRVGYVLKKYPRLSETFILNEILGLEGAGTDLSIFSLRLPDEGRFHADVARVGADVTYVPEFGSAAVWDAFRVVGKLGEPAASRFGRAVRFVERLPDSRRAAILVQGLHLGEAAVRRGVEHLHAHFMTIAAHAAYLAHIVSGIPFSVTAHAKDIYRSTVDREVFREIAAAASRIVTVSDFNRRHIELELLDGSPARVTRIYNGIPLGEIAAGSAPFRTEEGNRPRTILGVGRLVEKKGFHLLLEACRILADRGERFECVLVGDGEEAGRLHAERERLRLDGVVTFAGPLPREETFRRMREACVLAAPCVTGGDGNRDALPTVLLESLAHGLPVVSTRLSGIPEIVDDGEDGLLVPEGDAGALADALGRLLSDDGLRRRFAAAGLAKVREKFDRSRTLPQLLEVFREGAGRALPATGEAP
jgi:glycosyltransferase involved in cell wall biosynthesis